MFDVSRRTSIVDPMVGTRIRHWVSDVCSIIPPARRRLELGCVCLKLVQYKLDNYCLWLEIGGSRSSL